MSVYYFLFILHLFIFCLFFQDKETMFLLLNLLHLHDKLYTWEFT